MRLQIFILLAFTYTSTTRSTTESSAIPEFAGPSIAHPVAKRSDQRITRGVPVIRLENGHVSATTLEEMDRLRTSLSANDNSFNEGRDEEKIIHGELAYIHLIHDLAKQDDDLIEMDIKQAQSFMEATGKTVQDAQDAADRLGAYNRKRYVLKDEDLRWEKCIIPYQWGDGFDGQMYVAYALEVIQNYTGIRFVEYNEGVPDMYGLSHNNRLNFITGDGCWSYIGNVEEAGQNISCCWSYTCVHELGHAMGFMHEQTSPLRDDHVRIEFDGIYPRSWSQYYRNEKEDSLTFGYYDMTSVMHYALWGFSINYKDTMTALDPDLLYLIRSDTEEFYYFFSEVERSNNCMDQFCPNDKPVCVNDGYATVIHGQCACRCPRGLDPNTGCATLSTTCGEIYELSIADPKYLIKFPMAEDSNEYPTNEECVFIFKAPEGTTIQLDFEKFDVDCSDYLEIRNNLPGQPGARVCGNGFEESIDSNFNYLSLVFYSDANVTGKGFKAHVKLMTDEENCYTRKGKDYSYVGKVNYTRTQQSCLKWNEVPNCRFNRFSNSELDDDLDNNYCRSTGVGTAPWCYTNAETCAREYCDACGNNKCYDVFDDCANLIKEDAQFCEKDLDGQALRGCRKSCDKCVAPQPTGSAISCPPPPPLPSAYPPAPQKSVYRLGDKVEYKCVSSEDTRNRTCNSDGTWSEMGFVCGACQRGWAHINGKCFLWLDEFLNHDEAVNTCRNLKSGSTLAMPKTLEETDLMKQIIKIDVEEVRDTWIGLNKVNSEYVWVDGSALSWTNWKGEPKGKDCVFIRQDGTWVDTSCRNERSVVCEYQPGPRVGCADQISNCDDLIEATPVLCVNQSEFAWANCPLSCGMCGFENTVGMNQKPKRSVRQITDATDSSTSPTTNSVTPPTSSLATATASRSRNTGSTSPTTGSITPPTSSFATGTTSDIWTPITENTASTSPTTGTFTPPTTSFATGTTSDIWTPITENTASTSPTTGSVTPPTTSISSSFPSQSPTLTFSRATGSTSPTTGSITPPTSSAPTASRETAQTTRFSTSPTTGSVTPPTPSIFTASRETGPNSFSTSPTTGSDTSPTPSVFTASSETGRSTRPNSFSTSPTTGSVTPPTPSVSTGSRETGQTTRPNSFSTSPTTGSVTPPTPTVSTGSRETGRTTRSNSFSTSPTTGSVTPPTPSIFTGSRETGRTTRPNSFSTSPTTGSVTPPTPSVFTGSSETGRTTRSNSFSTSPTTGSVTPPTPSIFTGSRETGRTTRPNSFSTSPTTGSVTPPTPSVSTGSRETGRTTRPNSFSTSPTTGSVTPPTPSVFTGSSETGRTTRSNSFSTSPTTSSVTPPTPSVSTGSRETGRTTRPNSFSTSPTTGSVTPPTPSIFTGSRETDRTTRPNSFSTSPTTGSVTPPTPSVFTGSSETGQTTRPNTLSTSPTTGSVTPPTPSSFTGSKETNPDTLSTSPTTGSVTPPSSSFSTVTSITSATTVLTTTLTPEPSTENPVIFCLIPSTPENSVIKNGGGETEIVIGQIVEYECAEGFALAEGNLVRACLKTGFLTGSPPVCKDRSEVPEPVNDVNIRRRDKTPSEGFSYLSKNQDFSIQKAGNISIWKFYSTIDGSVTFQVWRPTNKEKKFTLIGQNTIDASLTDRVRTVQIPEAEQISVQPGDFLGIYFPRKKFGHVPYTQCALNYEPEHGLQLVSTKSKVTANGWNIGEDYPFSGETDKCKIWSLNAYI